ncbi:xanthine dehydrogenase family protein molybdopterin-binding subunit [Sphingomonas sp. IC-11]|uniref:xanthine dehydrogenase family protein molybdopterin-binding subunit n=1 Tax=Sphingomonas sp. IC-11 TaxID=2898528 RepID=UPI001E5A67B1|nr:xanthine dehydrogenase family protein molybdopterin-binding subunit [Sphingomonas sp. IC-11]MCD2314532.1 xanthine dehydrogenase family protein molybdopterin-binding subunit [Sphingomonas sp. IC-11]
MPAARRGPAYGLLDAGDLTDTSRRRFLVSGALMMGFAVTGKAWAQNKGRGEQPTLRAITPGGPEQGAAFQGFAPGGFIRIPREGKVSFIIPSVEMGQGIYTGEAMMMAEELELALEQIEVVHAPADEKLYSQPILKSQATGGSTSIRGAWKPMRQAAAAARTMLIAAAAERWRVAPDQCFADQGRVYCRTNGLSLPYGALVDAARGRPVPQEVPLKTPGQFKLIGRSKQRVDTPAKTNGTAVFGIDVQVPGMKVAALAMCPVQGGRVKAVQDRGVKQVPGVLGVLRIDDAVAVVADHFWAAQKGLQALDVEWDLGPLATLQSNHVRDRLVAAAENGKPVLGRSVGDADAALREAHSTVDARYDLPFLAHATMEPVNATVHVRPDGCDVWVGTQVPAAAQTRVAKAVGLPPERVFVHNQYLGGGFGRRLVPEHIVQAALFAKQVPFPLKVIQTREQDIRHDLFRPAYHDRLSMGLDAKGMPVVFTDRVTGGSVLADGSFLEEGLPEGTLDSDAVEGVAETPYAIPTVRVDWIHERSPVKVNWWRGVGPAANVHVLESFIDECAHAAGQDPVVYRLKMLRNNPRGRNVLKMAAREAKWGSSLPPRTARGVSLHQSFGSYVALICEAHVTPVGEIELRRLTAVADVGVAINPNSVIAQIEGGVIFGLSAALYNEITFTDGRVDQSNFNDYRQMRINEVPPFTVKLMESEAEPGGIGESGTVSAAPALGNAIFAATGIRLRSLPFRRQELMEKGAEKNIIAGTAAVAGLSAMLAGDAGEQA